MAGYCGECSVDSMHSAYRLNCTDSWVTVLLLITISCSSLNCDTLDDFMNVHAIVYLNYLLELLLIGKLQSGCYKFGKRYVFSVFHEYLIKFRLSLE